METESSQDQAFSYVFNYGSLCPKRYKKILNISLENVVSKCIPCILKNHTRFFDVELSSSKEQEGAEIKSYAIKLNKQELEIVDKFEEVDKNEYYRKQVQLQTIDGKVFDGYIYVKTQVSKINDQFALSRIKFLY